ncbi:hypothetical protein AAY473_029634 [Plecturocebus cupreus]
MSPVGLSKTWAKAPLATKVSGWKSDTQVSCDIGTYTEFCSCCSGWSAMARSRLTATYTYRVQELRMDHKAPQTSTGYPSCLRGIRLRQSDGSPNSPSPPISLSVLLQRRFPQYISYVLSHLGICFSEDLNKHTWSFSNLWERQQQTAPMPLAWRARAALCIVSSQWLSEIRVTLSSPERCTLRPLPLCGPVEDGDTEAQRTHHYPNPLVDGTSLRSPTVHRARFWRLSIITVLLSLQGSSLVAGITGMHHQARLMFVFLVEIGFCYVGQAGLKLLTSTLPSLRALAISCLLGGQPQACKELARESREGCFLGRPVGRWSAGPQHLLVPPVSAVEDA